MACQWLDISPLETRLRLRAMAANPAAYRGASLRPPQEDKSSVQADPDSSPWERVLIALLPTLVQNFPAVVGGVKLAMQKSEGPEHTHQGLSLPTGPNPPVSPSSSAQPGSPPTSPQPESNMPSNLGEALDDTHMLQMAAQFGPFVLNALAQGVQGGDFADSVSMMFGPLVYEQIAAQGKESILKMLQTHPEIWVQLKPLEGKLD